MSTSTDTDDVGTHAILEHVITQEPLPMHRFPIGTTTSDKQLVWWDPRAGSHLLIAGYPDETHDGLLRTILASSLALGWQVHWFDTRRFGTRTGYADEWGLPRGRFATTGEAMETTIHDINEEMHRRYTVLEADPHHDQFTPLLLICNQLGEAINAMDQTAHQRWAEQNPGKAIPKRITSPMVDALWTIPRFGRTVGVYLVAANHRPHVADLPGEVRDNCRTRWACTPLPQEDLRILFDAPSSRCAALHTQRHTNHHLVDRGHGVEAVAPLWTPNPANPATEADQRAAKRLRTLINQHSNHPLQHQ